MKTRNRFVAGALLGVLGFLGWFVLREQRPPQTASPAAPLEKVESLTAAVNEYAAQKAARPLPRFDVRKQATYLALAEKALDVKAEILAGNWKWSSTVLAVEDPAFAAEKRLKCDATLGKQVVKGCNYRIDMVLQPTTAGMGKVVHSRAVLLDSEPEPICSTYTECLAETRMEESVPLPADSGGEVAISQKINVGHPNPAMLDTERMDRMLGSAKDALEKMRKTMDLNDPRSAHELQRHEAILRYAEKRNRERKAELAANKIPANTTSTP